MADFYDGVAEETEYKLKRALEYVKLALSNGDAAYQEKPGEVRIVIRKPKEAK